MRHSEVHVTLGKIIQASPAPPLPEPDQPQEPLSEPQYCGKVLRKAKLPGVERASSPGPRTAAQLQHCDLRHVPSSQWLRGCGGGESTKASEASFCLLPLLLLPSPPENNVLGRGHEGGAGCSNPTGSSCRTLDRSLTSFGPRFLLHLGKGG